MEKKLTALFAFSIFVLIVGWAITPVQAHHDPGHSGGGGGGGKTHGTTVTTEAQWGGNITETISRPCVAAQVQQNGDYGSYVCQLDPATTNTVHYDLGVGVQTARKGDASLCTVFGPINLTPDRLYEYNWSDNCGDGTCTIEINNWFTGLHVTAATGGKADRITFRAFAEATGPFADANPFVDSLTLDVDEINISFSAAGSNKNIAVCHYSPSPGEVTFHSKQTE